jgi:hypothetical protein
LPLLDVTTGKNSIALNISHDWLEQHPLTRVDLKSEATYLSAINYKLVTK